jgi:3',5'-cyclic AMP phosphodiesterase CpdA
MADKTVIAHISDTHCGSRYHIPSLATRVIDELNLLDPDAVIVTGDLTDMGYRGEFRQAQRMLERIACDRRMVLIGNHDARNVGDVHFEEMFGARRCELQMPDMYLVGLDSSEPDLDSGRIGRDTHRWLAGKFAETADFKVVAMHHHLVPVPGTGRERNIVHDAGDLLRVLADSGVDMVLCGHKHVPNVWRLEDMLIINAGTCCTHRLRGRVRPSYNIIEIDEDGSHVRVLRKEPFVDAEVAADYRGIHQSVCGWRAEDIVGNEP